MKKENDWKQRLGMVYSTNPEFQYETEEIEDAETLPINKQKLRVVIDKRNRKGKTVTLVLGFIGKDEDLKELAKALKTHCGTGGSVKDHEIIIQGDVRTKIIDFLQKKGYTNIR